MHAPQRDVAGLRAAYGNFSHGIYLGEGPDGVVWSGAQRSTLVLGPSRSGKTSSLVIPNLFLANGPVISTSTKPDVMRATAAARGQAGYTFLYDPSGQIECPTGVQRVGWSPLTTAAEWDTACETARSMVRASKIAEGGASHSSNDQHWRERAESLLGPLLHAAALESMPMRTVVKWIDRHDGATALEVLAQNIGDDASATNVLAGIVGTDSRELSSIWSTASGVVSAYRSEGAMASTELPALNPADFCRGPHTIYICSPGRRQDLFAPLIVGLIDDVRDATYKRERDSDGDRAAPTLLALDEMANIAPIPDVEHMVTEGAGQGLLVLACLQDLSQGRKRWGASADAWFSQYGATVVLPGIADRTTLQVLSTLAGDREVETTTRSQSVNLRGQLTPSSSTSTIRLPRYAPSEISQGRPGSALVFGAQAHLSSVNLTPAHACRPWRQFLPARTLPDRSLNEHALLDRPRDDRALGSGEPPLRDR